MQATPFESVPDQVLKRAQYEALEFELIDTDVLVRNASHAEPAAHEYRVTIEAGVPTYCPCPADAQYKHPCKHRVAVAIRPPILEVVTTVQRLTDEPRSLTTTTSALEAIPSEPPVACECAGLDGFPCWECYRTGCRELP